MPDPTDDDLDIARHPRPFRDWLGEQRGGATHAELTEGLADLVSAVDETGKAGSIRLTIKVSPAGKGSYTVTVADEVLVKLPEFDRDTSTFFIDRTNSSLQRRDPYQGELALQEVPRPSTDLREA